MADPTTVVHELGLRLGVARSTIWELCRRFESDGVEVVNDAPRPGRPRAISPLERVQIEQLACCDPSGIGLELTSWSTRALAAVAREQGIVPRIAHSTVSLILRNADLQPHRTRYWKTPSLDAEFRHRAAQVLWCYETAAALAERDEVVLCLDEKPNMQVLERRCPTLRTRSRLIERQEFEYVRHGTVNFLAALVVHSVEMRGWCLDANNGECLRAVLPELFRQHRRARRIHVIWDGGSSHVARETRAFLRNYPKVRALVTPAHASWLNQAELLLCSFSAHYLQRSSWASRREMMEHLDASWPEYNRLFAHPISWSWTRARMHAWVDRHH